MKTNKILTITTILILTTTMGMSQLPPANNTDRITLDLQQTNRINEILDNTFSVSLDQTQVEQGDTVTGAITDPISAVGDYGEAASCDGDQVEIKIDWINPSGENVATDYLTADECDFYSVDYSFSVWSDAALGEWTVQADYRHENVGDLTGDKVYDFGSDTYEVVSSTTTQPEPEPEPKVELSETPGFTVDQSSNTVLGEIGVKNTGTGGMDSTDIVEMQVRPKGSGPLSFTTSQQVCDSDYPNNVHVGYELDAGDSRSISLTAGTDLQDGESYSVYFLTREACAPDNDPVEPIPNSYNAGSFTLDSASGGGGTGDGSTSVEPNVEQVSNPQVSINGDTVSTKVHFKNSGGGMSQKDIVEMQVRPEGAGPLAFSSNQQVCDQAYPNNVHKEFELVSGESDSTTLTVDGLTDGKYDVYVLTRDGCYPDNSPVNPYTGAKNVGTVNVATSGDGNGGSVGLPSTAVLAGIGGILVLILGIFAVVIGVIYR